MIKKINIQEDIDALMKDQIKMDADGTDNKGEKNRIEGFSTPPTSLLQAIERIDMVATDCELEMEKLKAATPEINYLAKRVGINAFQAILLSVVVNSGEDVSISRLSRKLSISTARALSLLSEFKELERLHLIKIDDHFRGISFSIPTKVLVQLSRNKDFEHEPTSGLDSTEFLSRCHKLFSRSSNHNITRDELGEEVKFLIDENKDCTLVKELKKLNLTEPYELILLTLCDALVSEEQDTINIHSLWTCALNATQFNMWKREFRLGAHDLIKMGFVECGCEHGIVNTQTIGLTKQAREKLLKDVEVFDGDGDEPLSGVIESSTIKPKDLYYDGEVAKQVDELTKFFGQDNYKSIIERLEKNNFRRAFTCLFYGGPGTGKTETVNQLARLTGRDIMLVDVPNLKDKYVGESEKNVKAVFNKYHDLVKRSKVAPILLFNEADSIFGKRLANVKHSVDQMLNTIQNIILQEMENMEGILIATTNLTENLDAAFERRFLYKIRFGQPSAEAREHIWHSMIPTLTNDEAKHLANSYEFSGGQIENVARKFSINTILYGENENNQLDTIVDFCNNEKIQTQDSSPKPRRVGF